MNFICNSVQTGLQVIYKWSLNIEKSRGSQLVYRIVFPQENDSNSYGQEYHGRENIL